MHKFIKNQFAVILFFFILFIIGFFAYDDYGIGIDEVSKDTPTLIKMIDVLGREQQEHKKGSLLFYIYDSGKVEKRVIN